jgi:signal transduction histidine kinase
MTSTTLRPPVRVARRIWAETWRLVVVVLVGLFAFATVWSTTDVEAMSESRLGAHLLVDVVVGVLALVLVPFRHRAPLLVSVLVIVGSAVSTLAVGAAALALVSLAARRRPVEIAIGGGVFVLSSVLGEGLYSVDDTTPLWQIVVASVVVIALVVAIGVGIGQRRALLDGLRERAALLERDQQLREDRAREQERAHLAREMHDVLGHRLSLVALHAGALEYRGRSLSPDETVEAAGVVRAEAHAALTELRDVLGVLRDPAEAVSGAAPPQPTLRDLPALLDEARATGAVVTASVDDRTATVPDAVGRHAYRVVQEALTNARRHAPGRPVDLRLVVVDGPALQVHVANPVGPGHGADPGTRTDPDAGHGLRGLAERARLVGGTFRAGPDGTEPDRFVVEVVLPWTA